MTAKHYLVTIAMREGVSRHGYLMSREDVSLQLAEKMVDDAEKDGLHPFGIILMTGLEKSGIKCVRDILTRNSDEVASMLKKAKRFHVSIFTMSDNHPDADKLMALH